MDIRSIPPPSAEELLRHRITILPTEAASSPGGGGAYRLTEDPARLLRAFGQQIRSPGARVSGMLLLKRTAPLLSGVLYVWSLSGMGWSRPLHEAAVRLEGSGLAFELPPPHRLGPEAAKAVAAGLVRDLAELVRGVAACTGAGEPQLWATAAYHLAYYEREWAGELAKEPLERMRALLACLREGWDPAWAPGCTSSPFTRSFREAANPCEPAQTVLVRASCCLNYKLPGPDGRESGRHCYTCPLLCDQERHDQLLKRSSG